MPGRVTMKRSLARSPTLTESLVSQPVILCDHEGVPFASDDGVAQARQIDAVRQGNHREVEFASAEPCE